MIKDYTDHKTQRAILMDYMQVMIDRSDWHGVSDAANDLRVLEAEQKNRMSERNIQISDTKLAESLQPIDQEPLLEGWPLWSGLPQPKKEWVKLTDEEIEEVGGLFPFYSNEWCDDDYVTFACAVEAKLKEKNGF